MATADDKKKLSIPQRPLKKSHPRGPASFGPVLNWARVWVFHSSASSRWDLWVPAQRKLLEPQKRHGPTRLGSLFPHPLPLLADPPTAPAGPASSLADSSPPGHSLISRSAGCPVLASSSSPCVFVFFGVFNRARVCILSCLGWNRWLGRSSRVGGDGFQADPEGAQGPAEGSPHILQRR